MTIRTPILSVGLFVFFSLVYLWASPSLVYQHWDSLAYARACEVRGARAIWGNHPLGHIAACGVFGIARRLGYEGRALQVLKIFNGIIGAAAVAVFLMVLTTVLQVNRVQAVGWAVVLGAAYGFWHYAGTADIYSVSVLLLILAWASLMRRFTSRSNEFSVLPGVLAGIATLAHQYNGVLLAVGVIGLLFFEGRGERRLAVSLGVCLSVAMATIAIGYALLGSLTLGSFAPTGIGAWAIGYGADSTYGRFLTVDGLKHAAYSAAETFLRRIDGGESRPVLRVSVVVMCAILPLVGLISIWQLPGRLKAIAFSCALQCVVGGLLIVWWEPTTFGKWWLLMLPVLIGWFACVLEGALQRGLSSRLMLGGLSISILKITPSLLGAFCLWFNSGALLRERGPSVAFEQSVNVWVEHSEPDDVLIENWGLTPYLLYWGRRPGTLELYGVLRESRDASDRFAKLREVLEQAVQQNRAVLFAPGLSDYYSDERLAVLGIHRHDVVRFFDEYQRYGPLFSYQGASKQVYRLAIPHRDR